MGIVYQTTETQIDVMYEIQMDFLVNGSTVKNDV